MRCRSRSGPRCALPQPPPPPHMAPFVCALPARTHLSPLTSRLSPRAGPILSHVPTTAARHPPHAHTYCMHMHMLYVFMPQGLGINRGFLHSLDCADLAAGFAAVVARREASAGGETAAAAEVARREGAQLLRLTPALTLTLTPTLTLTLTRCAAAAAARGDLRVHQAREREQPADRAQEAHRQAAASRLQDRPRHPLH